MISAATEQQLEAKSPPIPDRGRSSQGPMESRSAEKGSAS